MAKFIKLPSELKNWKTTSVIAENDGTEIYTVVNKSTNKKAILRHVSVQNDDYNDESTSFFKEEAEFIETVKDIDGASNYVDVCVRDNPSKLACDLFIVTEDSQNFYDVMKSKKFSEEDIVDFGLQMGGILEKLEEKDIFHGNVSPKNIFITEDGKYTLGGFTDFESKISDMSFVAPEVYNHENADYTTDIYSVGLIMYAMANDGKIPFENENCDRKEAIQKRFSGETIPAPGSGDEKLKSIIMIACQSTSDNRWKNAGNIKNALSSVKEDSAKSSPDLVAPSSTSFDDNVFEEYDYEEFEDAEPAHDESEIPTNNSASDTTDNISDDENKGVDTLSMNDESIEMADVTEDVPQSSDSSDENEENNYGDARDISSYSPIKNKDYDEVPAVGLTESSVLPVVTNEDVFDEYAAKESKNELTSTEKDYGNYFDDDSDEDNTLTDETSAENADSENATEFDNNRFEDEAYYGDDRTQRKGGKGKAVIIICVVVIAAALAFIGFCIFNGISKSADNNTTASSGKTAASEQTTVQATTAEPTTAVQTTVQATTVPSTENVVSVVGYGYSYGKKLLEQAGFTVEISDYQYSYYYDEGYIIAQTPEGNTSASTETVVSLVISSGRISEESSQAESGSSQVSQTSSKAESSQSSSSSKTTSTSSDEDFLFANSDSAYLSSSQVAALSDSELQLAINEIYARRGRIFKDSSLNAYFNSKSWYEGKYTEDEFWDNVNLNSYEQKNLNLLTNERKSRS